MFALMFFVPATSATAQVSATTCGYGTGGPFAPNLCWFDMTGYDDPLARTPPGQQMSVALSGGYTASFTISSTPIAGTVYAPVESRTAPLEPRFAFGSLGYVGVPGRPVLYSLDPSVGVNGVTLTLSDIAVTDASGALVTGYRFVIADAENNITDESFTWTSDKPLNLLGVLNPNAPRGCEEGLSGLGTTSVTCTGQGFDPPGLTGYDDVVVGADTPSTIGLSMRTFARSGVAFAIMTSKVQVTKNVVGRVRAGDSFDVAATSPEGSTIASAGTGATNSATTGELVVLPRTTGAVYTLGEAATPGSGTVLSDYSRSWSCTNNGVADAVLSSSTATSVAVSPAAGDFIACTITNTAPPTVAIVSPPPVLEIGSNPPVDFACTAPAGLTSCTATVRLPDGRLVPIGDGAPAPTDVPGTYTITAIVIDALGNTATMIRTYQVLAPGDLVVVKTVDKTVVDGNEPITWTFTVTNRGPGVSTGVVALDETSRPVTFTSLTSTAGTCANTVPVRCELGTIAAGASVKVTLVGTARLAGPLSNGVTVSARRSNGQPVVDPAPASNVASASTTVRGSLRIRKTANKARVRAGGRIAYRIRVTNPSGVGVRSVRVCDRLPGGLAFLGSSPRATRVDGRYCWNLQTIAARGSKTVSLTVRVLRGTRGSKTNSATVSGRGVGARSDAAPAVRVLGAASRGGGVTG